MFLFVGRATIYGRQDFFLNTPYAMLAKMYLYSIGKRKLRTSTTIKYIFFIIYLCRIDNRICIPNSLHIHDIIVIKTTMIINN